MSKFTYEKIGEYGSEVKDSIEKNDGVLLALDGKNYKIRTDNKSFYGRKNGFKDRIDNNKFIELNQELRKNQFEILEYPPEALRNNGTLKDIKYKTLGWTQLEKSVFTSSSITIDTAQQEKITLKIFEYVLGSKTQNWRSFDEMFRDGVDKNGNAVSGVAKIFPDLSKLPDWYAHFTLQFNEIKSITKLPNNEFEVFQYDGEGSFMKYISDLVVKEMNLYSRKDSWNPADIWLVNSVRLKQYYIQNFNKIALNLKNGEYKDPKQAIREINAQLKTAFNQNLIVGISLKKSDGKKLNYETFNLQANPNDSASLPDVNFDKIQLDCKYNKTSGTFPSRTSYIFVKDAGDLAYKLAYKSNTGGKGNITYEFLPSGPASAFLGKVPKDRLQEFLKKNVPLALPGKFIDSRKVSSSAVYGNPFVTEMAQRVTLPVTMPQSTMDIYDKKVAFIKTQFASSQTLHIDSFVENLKDSYEQGFKAGVEGLSVKNNTMIQMVEFTYQLAQMKKEGNLQEFLTKTYYFAQKRGQIYDFGPFGKLY